MGTGNVFVNRAIASLLAIAIGGCSTTATITRLSGPPVEGSIEGGTRDAIIVDTESGPYAIPRTDVSDVDHPGNVHAAVGGGIAAYGVLNIAFGLPRCQDNSQFQSDSEQGGFCTGIFLPAVVGASMILWGLLTYSSSKRAEEDTSFVPPPGAAPYPSWQVGPAPRLAYPYALPPPPPLPPQTPNPVAPQPAGAPSSSTTPPPAAPAPSAAPSAPAPPPQM